MTSEVTATSDPVILSGAGALVLGVIGEIYRLSFAQAFLQMAVTTREIVCRRSCHDAEERRQT